MSTSSVTRRALRIFPCYMRLVRDDSRYRNVGDLLPEAGGSDVSVSPSPPDERVRSLAGRLAVVAAPAEARSAWPTGDER